MKKILHDKTKAGIVVAPTKDRTPIYDKPTGGAKIDAIDRDALIGVMSGDIVYNDDKTAWLRVSLIKPSAIGAKQVGWVRNNDVMLSKSQPTPVASGKVEGMLNEMLEQDAEIVRRLQRVYNATVKLHKAGKDTTKISAILGKLLSGIVMRQNKLKASKDIKLSGYLQTNIVINDKSVVSGIGIAPLVIAGVCVLVGVASAIALYYAFRPDYYDSKKDFVITGDLEKMIDANIPDPDKREELKEKIKEAAQPQLQKAFEDGQDKQKFGDIFSMGKYLAIGVGAYLLFTKLNEHKK